MWPRKGGAGDALTEAEKGGGIRRFPRLPSSSGSYELVGDALTTRAYIHLNPTATRAWPNRTRLYRVRIEGDTLHWDFGDGGVGRFRRVSKVDCRRSDLRLKFPLGRFRRCEWMLKMVLRVRNDCTRSVGRDVLLRRSSGLPARAIWLSPQAPVCILFSPFDPGDDDALRGVVDQINYPPQGRGL